MEAWQVELYAFYKEKHFGTQVGAFQETIITMWMWDINHKQNTLVSKKQLCIFYSLRNKNIVHMNKTYKIKKKHLQ